MIANFSQKVIFYASKDKMQSNVRAINNLRYSGRNGIELLSSCYTY